jgi:hypothetical protein
VHPPAIFAGAVVPAVPFVLILFITFFIKTTLYIFNGENITKKNKKVKKILSFF